MIGELLYTSSPRGLKPFSTGYCTVAHTKGMKSHLIEALEGLSRFEALHTSPDSDSVAAVWRYQRLRLRGQTHYVLSRLGPNGTDFSGRAIFLAHHIVLAANDRPTAGPAHAMLTPGLFRDHFAGEAGLLVARSLTVTNSSTAPGIGASQGERFLPDGWHELWAKRLTETSAHQRKSLYVIYPSALDPLGLMSEVEQRIQAPLRWQTTFCSGSLESDHSETFTCRLIAANSWFARSLRENNDRNQILDLSVGSERSVQCDTAARGAGNGSTAIHTTSK